jgi:hypothetical protein
MNLVLGLLWLAGAVALFGYEAATGDKRFRIPMLGDISAGWVSLLLAGYNFVRWYSSRMSRADQEAMRIVHEARLRQARTRDRPSEPDPTFDFTSKPPSPRGPTELPPSNN